MWEYGFSLTHILSYKDRIVDSFLIQENTVQWKSVFWHILCSKNMVTALQSKYYYSGDQCYTQVKNSYTINATINYLLDSERFDGPLL